MKAISQIQRQTRLKTSAMAWLRRYFIAVGLDALGCARWKYNLFIHAPKHGGWGSFQTWEFVMDGGAYLLVVVLMLAPWWRLGGMITPLGYAIVLPSCAYVIVGFLIVDLVYVHEQIWFHLLLLTGLVAQVVWLFIPLAAESRQIQIAELCKQHLRRKHREKPDLVEEFIVEIEGTGKNQNLSKWGRFADLSRKDDEILKRLDREFEKRLEP